jgi:hypothetical protein
VYGVLAGNVFGAFVTEGWQVDTGKQILASAHENWPKRKMQFVDEFRSEILLNRRDTATDPYIPFFRSILRALQSGVDAVGDKMKRCSTFHLE